MAIGGASGRSQLQRRTYSEEALLAAASQLIAQRGVGRTSLARIGQLAGLSRGLPNHHFGSKDALLERVAARAQNRNTAATGEAVERKRRQAGQLSALDTLRVLVDEYLARLETDPPAEAHALIVMWGATFPSEASMEVMTAADQRAYDGLAARIREGQEEGSIRPDADPAGAAVVLLGLLRGVGALILTKPDGTDFNSVRRTCQSWITASLAHPYNGHRPTSARRGARHA